MENENGELEICIYRDTQWKRFRREAEVTKYSTQDPTHVVHILADISIYMQMPHLLSHLDFVYSPCVRAKVKAEEFPFVVLAFLQQ